MQGSEKINRTLINFSNSTSKQHYSFTKSQRFIENRLNESSSLPSLYHLSRQLQSKILIKDKSSHSTLSRAERKFLFQNQKQLCLIPGPSDYNLSNSQLCKTLHVGETIGIKMKSNKAETTPSPADYRTEIYQHFQKISFNAKPTFTRQKKKEKLFGQQGMDSPGPKYLIEGTFERLKNRKVRVIKTPSANLTARINRLPKTNIELLHVKPQKQEAFKLSKQKGRNQQRTSFKKGKLSNRSRKFLISDKSRASTVSPGPGSYNIHSEFQISFKLKKIFSSSKGLAL